MFRSRTGRARVNAEPRGFRVCFHVEDLGTVLESRAVKTVCRGAEKAALAGLRVARSVLELGIKNLEEDLGRRESEQQSLRKITID